MFRRYIGRLLGRDITKTQTRKHRRQAGRENLRKELSRQLNLEHLEDRRLLTTYFFSNAAYIYLPDPGFGSAGPASPYPSSIAVAAVPGNITQVSATLSNFTHTQMNDLAILLQSPANDTVELMRTVGAGNVANVTYTFADGNSALSGGAGTGTYRPTQAGVAVNYPGLTSPFGTTMASLNGASANGTWNLYAFDTALLDVGSVANGYSLAITTDTGTTFAYDAASNPGIHDYTLRISGGNLQIVETANPSHVLAQQSAAGTDNVQVTGQVDVADTLTVDNSNGNPIPAGGLSYDGGAGIGNDTLISQGGNFTSVVSSPTGAHSGTLTYSAGATVVASITYSNLAPISDVNFATNFTINATNGDETINVVTGPSVGGFQTDQVNDGGSGTFELVNFANKTNVTVDAVDGVDTITVNIPTIATGLSRLIIEGGPTDGDTVSLQVTPAGLTTNWVGDAQANVNLGLGNTVAALAGSINLENPNDYNTIVINDQNDVTGRTVTLSSFAPNPEDSELDADEYGKISGLAPADINYEYDDTTSVTINAGTNADEFDVQATGVTTTINAGPGGDKIVVSSAAPFYTGNLSAIAGTLNLNLGTGTGLDQTIWISDYTETVTPNTNVVVTNSAITGFAGPTNATPINYSASAGSTNGLVLVGSNTLADTFNVQSTNGLFWNSIFTYGGDDIVNVSSTAPTRNANTTVDPQGTLTGDLNGILGTLNIDTGANATAAGDTVNVSDFGSPLSRTYQLDNVGGADTQLSVTGGGGPAVSIAYNVMGSGAVLEHFNLIGSDIGDNTYNINATTATQTNHIADGDQTPSVGTNNATFNLTGDNLSANNTFFGFDGNDQFVLNIAGNIGTYAVPGGAIAGLQIEGDANAGTDLSINRDRLTVNDNSGSARQLDYFYLTSQGDLNVAPDVGGAGLFGGNLPDGVVAVRSMETYIFNAAGTPNDLVSVFGATPQGTWASFPDNLGVDDILTVALRNNRTSALVFLNGTPYLDTPPVSIAPTAARPGNTSLRPGVAGGGLGTDLDLNGLGNPNINPGLPGELNLDGNDAPDGGGDRAVVYGLSDNDLVDLGNPTDIFGFGPGVFQPAAGGEGGFDTFTITDSRVSTTNTHNGGTPLTTVTLNAGSFVQNVPESSTQRAALVVNGGDEAGPRGSFFDALHPDAADIFLPTISQRFNIQTNGNLPVLSTGVFGQPQGDELDVTTIGPLNVFSDTATPPNATITQLPYYGPYGIRFSSIERTYYRPGNGTVNIIGDNNTPGVNQNDYFKVRGQDVDFNPSDPNALNGQGEFTLQIGGNWNPLAGPPGSVSLSAPIFFRGVSRINAVGGAADLAQNPTGNDPGYDAQGNVLPELVDTGVDVLDIRAYADNTNLPTHNWGIQTFFNEGDPVGDGGNGVDLLIYNGVSGVSEAITVQPSASQAGQIFDVNTANGQPIATVNYVLNTNLIVNGSSLAGTAGDTDSLTLRGTDPANPGTSGNDFFDADFTRAGTPGNELVRVTDSNGGAPLYNLETFSNFNTLNVQMLGGADSMRLIGRNDGSLTVNVDGGNDAAVDGVDFLGTLDAADTFSVQQGSAANAATVSAQRFAATGVGGAATQVNLTNVNLIDLDGGAGTGSDSITVAGTSASNTFTVQSGVGDGISGLIGVDNFPNVFYFNLGSGIVGGAFSSVSLTGGRFDAIAGTQGIDAIQVTGTPGADAFTYTPTGANAGTLRQVNGSGTVDYQIANFASLALDGRGGNDTLTVKLPAPAKNLVDYEFNAFRFEGSVAVNSNGQPLLPIQFQNIAYDATAGIVIDGTANTPSAQTSDTLLYGGRTEVDQIAVDKTGLITDAPLALPVRTSGIEGLVLLGRGGNDVFDIAADHPFNSIIVTGGSPVTASNPDSGGDLIVVRGAASRSETITVAPNPWIDSETYIWGTGPGAAPTSTISSTGVGRIYYLGALNTDNIADDTLVVDPGQGTSAVQVDHGRFTGSPLLPGPYDRVTSDTLPEVQFSAVQTLQIEPNSANPVVPNPVNHGSAVVTFVTGDLAEASNYRAKLRAQDTLIIAGNDASADNYTVSNPVQGALPTNPAVAVKDEVSGNTVTATLATLGRLEINTLGGDDRVFVNNAVSAGVTEGLVTLPSGITFNGGLGKDTLALFASATLLTGTTYNVGVTADAGNVVQTSAGGTQTVFFTGLEPTVMEGTGPLTINGTNANNAINYTQGLAMDVLFTNGALPDDTTGLVSVDGFETDEFSGFTTLTLNGESGSDTINLGNSVAPTSATLTSALGTGVTAGQPVITILGNDATSGSDTVIINGTTGADRVTVTPTLADKAVLTGTTAGTDFVQGVAQVNVETTESLIYNGLGGNDLLTVVGTTGDDTVVHTPGSARDAGTVQVNSLLPITYANVGTGGSVSINGDTGSDTLVARGTGTNDTFAVAATTGTVSLVSLYGTHIDLINLATGTPAKATVEKLTLDGLSGDDTFTITASQPYTNIAVWGGDPDASDVLNLNDAPLAVAVDLEKAEVTGYGATVSFTGVEHVNLDGADTLAPPTALNALTVNGTSLDDRITYTPTGARAGKFQNEGSNTAFSFKDMGGTFTVAGGTASADELFVEATNSRDTITINENTPRTVQVNALKAVVLDSTTEVLTARGLDGQDTFIVVPQAALVAQPLLDNLLVYVEGGAPHGSDALVIAADTAGAALPATNFVVLHRDAEANAGSVRVFQDQPGAGNAPFQLPDIGYSDVEVVSPNVFVDAVGDPNLLVLGPDTNEPNEYRANSTFLGSGAVVQEYSQAVFPMFGEYPAVAAVPADQDYFKVVAQTTGTLDFQVYFNLYSPNCCLTAGT